MSRSGRPIVRAVCRPQMVSPMRTTRHADRAQPGRCILQGVGISASAAAMVFTTRKP